jgi:hypothetical protein
MIVNHVSLQQYKLKQNGNNDDDMERMKTTMIITIINNSNNGYDITNSNISYGIIDYKQKQSTQKHKHRHTITDNLNDCCDPY